MFFAERVRNKFQGIQTQDLLNTSQMLSYIKPVQRECKSVGIWLRPLGNAAYVACLSLLCQGSE